MIAFIVKYWLEFLFGLVAAGASYVAKRFYNLYKKEKEHQRKDDEDTLKATISKEILQTLETHQNEAAGKTDQLQAQINSVVIEMETLKDGILSIQGRNFKTDCRLLLQKDHVITQEEWESISVAHDIYNSLGGNHDGDRLYEDVETKYHNNLI